MTPTPTALRADDLYRQRARPGAVEESVQLLTRARTDDFENLWRLSRSLFFLGQESESRSEKAKRHREAVLYGRRAIAAMPGRVEGHFWLGVNLSLFAEAAGGLSALVALFQARRALNAAVRICESYHAAGPLRVLARLTQKSPRLLGGSLERASALYARALAISPGNTVTLLYAAETALERGEREIAADLLGRVLDASDSPDWEFEEIRDKRIARALLEHHRL